MTAVLDHPVGPDEEPIITQNPDVYGDQNKMTMIDPAPSAPVAEDSAPANHPYSPMAALFQWNEAFGVKTFIEEDAYGRQKGSILRASLIKEETKEVVDEILDLINGNGDRAKLAKELGDLLYVTYQAAYYFEIPIYEVFRAVHDSNMSKLGLDGKPVLRADGKILKGPHYFEPNIAAILGGVSD